jgi:hypothetical protein
MTWCPRQPHIYLKRHGFVFEHFEGVEPAEGVKAMVLKNAELLLQLLKDEWLKGQKHTGRTLEAISPIPQKVTRQALHRLLDDGRVISERVTGGGRGGAHSHLRPVELPMTT